MPRNKKVKTLAQCCYRRIALSFEKSWMKDYKKNFNDLPRLLYVIGPFDHLTEDMVQHLLEALVRENCLQRPHFTLLLKPQITHLNLMDAGLAANNDSVAKIVSHNCPKLVFLGLHGMNKISARALADLVSLLPRLRSLELSQTNCNDQVLSNIGCHCQELTNLNIKNTKTTNSGAFSICRACHPEEGCKKLVKLNIHGTMIDCKGALHCLQNLSNLQYLGFDDTCALIEQDVKERTSQGKETISYGLRNLTANCIKVPTISQQSISQACNLCELAVEVNLLCDVDQNTLLSVRNLSCLTALSIGNGFTHLLTFQNSVLPVLKSIGHQLLDLTLADINDFDLLEIGHCCKNIQSLSLCVSEVNEDGQNLVPNLSMNTQTTIFSKLNNLKVINYPAAESNNQMNAFLTLLKNAKQLSKMNLQYILWMTSDIFFNILEENPMVKLSELTLVYCNNIGGDVIQKLVHGTNDLTKVIVHKCKNISLQETEKINRYAKNNNLDFIMQWDLMTTKF